MKYFLFKTIFLSILFFLIVTLFVTYGKMFYASWEYPMWKSKLEYISNSTSSQNIIIGDSRATAGLLPKVIDDNFYNLAVGGGTPIEGYFFLKRLLLKNTPKNIIISFAPFNLEYADCFIGRTASFSALSKKEIYETMSLSYDLNEDFTKYENREYKSKTNYYTQLSSALIYSNFFYYHTAELQGLSRNTKRPFNNYRIYNEIKSNDGFHSFGMANSSSGLNTESRKERFIPSKVMSYYLEKILELATENDINVYYINAPFNKASFQNVSSNYIDSYNAYFKNLRNKYTNIFWYNEIYSYDNKYFGDPSHLNLKGNEKFSKYIRDNVLK